MNTGIEHPLAVFLAAPATSVIEPDEEAPYDPLTQLQGRWKDIPDHIEILCSGKRTGDPETRSNTTQGEFGQSDHDTDDSGT